MRLDQEDGVTRLNRVGESPNAFFGYRYLGVVESMAQSEALGLHDYRNRIFEAGDAIFQDFNEDGIIDEEDQTLRSEEHTSELQSLMRISYAVFCLKKKTIIHSLYMYDNSLL